MGSINLYKIDNAKLPDFLRELGKYEERDARQQETIFYKGIMPSETGFRFSSGL